MAESQEKKLLTIVARSIGRIPAGDWVATPPMAKRSYLQAAQRAVTAVRKFDKQQKKEASKK